MSLQFDYRDYSIELSCKEPPVCADHEKTKHFEQVLRSRSELPKLISFHQLVSWILGRLSYFSLAQLDRERSTFTNDGGFFSYHFKVTKKGKLAGKFGITVYQDRIAFSGFGVEEDVQQLFLNMLLSEPKELDTCKIIARDPDSGTLKTFGWDGHSFIG